MNFRPCAALLCLGTFMLSLLGAAASAAPAPSVPSTVSASGIIVVVPNEAPPGQTRRGAPANPPRGATGSRVYLQTKDDRWIRLTGSAIRSAKTGSTFRGRLAVPVSVRAKVAAAGSTPTASSVVATAERLDAPMAVTSASIVAPAVADSPKAHTLDVLYLYKPGDRVPSRKDAQAMVGRLNDFWTSQSGGQITSMRNPAAIQFREAPSTLDVCDAGATWSYAPELFGVPGSSYFAGNGRHLVVIVPGSRCGLSGGLGTVSPVEDIHLGGITWSTVPEDDPTYWDGTIFHEIGHNLSLSHDAQRRCTSGAVDAPYVDGAASAPCTDYPYLDHYDVMAGAFWVDDPNGGYLTSTEANVPTLNVTQRAALNALPIDSTGIRPITYSGGLTQTVAVPPAANPSGVRGLQITDPETNELIYVEYRYPTGRDSNSMYATYQAKTGRDDYAPGVRILRAIPVGSAGSTSTAISRAADSGGVYRMWWPAGSSYTSYNRNVTVKVNSSGSSGASVTVSFASLPRFTSVPKPTIDGQARLGYVLSAEGAPPSSWVPNADAVTYQWLRDNAEIRFATRSWYEVEEGDVGATLSVRVTATRRGYAASASVSDGVTVTPETFDSVPKVSITGTPAVGSTLTATGATADLWTPAAATVAYQWLRNNAAIERATSQSYQVTDADEGATLTVRATGWRPGFARTSTVSDGLRVPAPPVAPKPKVTRLNGSSRYTTAVKTSLEAFPPGRTVPVLYLANASGWQDSVAASAAAEYQRGSILLVPSSGTVPAEVLTRIKQLSPGRIVIVGDTRDIADSVISQVRSAHPRASYTRIPGGDVYDTSRKVTAYAFANHTGATVWVVDGRTFGEATVASRAAGARGESVVLVDGSKPTLDAATWATIAKMRPARMFVIGGTGSVSPGIEAQLKAAHITVRVGGPDQYATAIELNRINFGSTSTKAYLISGDTWLEATTIGVSATRTWTPVFLTKRACVPSAVLTDLASRKTQYLTAVGGPLSISTPAAQLKPCR